MLLRSIKTRRSGWCTCSATKGLIRDWLFGATIYGPIGIVGGMVFFTLPHYDGYPVVLVRLAAIAEDELEEVLREAWRVRAPRRLLAAYDAANAKPPAE